MQKKREGCNKIGDSHGSKVKSQKSKNLRLGVKESKVKRGGRLEKCFHQSPALKKADGSSNFHPLF
jgi:hypothetical protein